MMTFGNDTISPILLQQKRQLEEAQRRKRVDLDNYVSNANQIIVEIEKINNDIDRANNIVTQVNKIPGMFNSVASLMNEVGESLHAGIQIDGANVGAQVVNDASTIASDITSNVDAITIKAHTYCTNKNLEGTDYRNKALLIEEQYNSRLASYPQDLGSFGPAPIFPVIPEIKTSNI